MEFHALSGNAFVGREDEIRLLEAELAEASADRGRLVTLAGDAGIGKTRAVEEFVARAPIPSAAPCPVPLLLGGQDCWLAPDASAVCGPANRPGT
jgi:hypothetical protein